MGHFVLKPATCEALFGSESTEALAKFVAEHRHLVLLVLREAALRNHLPAARYLLTLDIDQRRSDWDCKTPLMYAATAGHLEMVKLLCEHPTGGRLLARQRDSWGNSASDMAKKTPANEAVVTYLRKFEYEALA